MDQKVQTSLRLPLLALLSAWIIGIVAAAGPTWEKLPQPLVQKQSARVILWDLSPSMMAEDTKPNRLTRSRFKLVDLLNTSKEGLTALVVYGGEAYVVTPLSDDNQTIISQLSALSPQLMPVRGSNTEMAVETGIKLLNDAGFYQGELLLVTDGVVPSAARTIERLLSNTNIRLSVLAVGSQAGAPVPLGNSFARDSEGNVVIDKVDVSALEKLAQSNGGKFVLARKDNQDIQYLTMQFDDSITGDDLMVDADKQRQFDQWRERGPYLALLLIPIVALSFRRGWVLPGLFLFALSLPVSPPAAAFEWADLWATKDQRAHRLLESGDAAAAAELFEDEQWSASAHFRNGNYQSAAEMFDNESANGLYNKGTALAQAGQLEAALAALNKALELQPEFDDARHNKDIIEQMLEQQQDQKQDGQGGHDQNQPPEDGQSGQDQDQSSQNQSQSDEQSGQQAQNQDQSSGQEGEQQEQSQPPEQPQTAQNSNSDDGEQSEGETSSDSENTDAEEQEQLARDFSEQMREAEQNQTENELATATMAEGELTDEQQQALEQWLKQVPDDPSGLLRRKFQHEYRQRRQQYRLGEWQLPQNDAASRL
jgi:Ca-activated chloride channel family protein